MEKKTFLNFYKLILEKVQFSSELYWKEYEKALATLNEKERDDLNHWIYKRGKNRMVNVSKK